MERVTGREIIPPDYFCAYIKRTNPMKQIQFKAPSLELENKTTSAEVEIKAGGESGILQVKAYALAFGNIDSWGDIILPGACDDFLKSAEADRMALCWQHDRTTVIGKITDKGVDAKGMWIEAEVLPTSAGQDAAILLKAGAVKEFSIGYRADRFHWERREGYEYDIRVIEALTVFECSPVTIAANPEAIVVSAKSDSFHNNHHTTNNQTMTPEEIKSMQESIEQAATEKVTAELNAKMDEIKAQQEKIDAQAKSIENLDKTAKAQQKTIDELRVELKDKARPQDFKSAFRAALEEKKETIEKAFAEKKNSFDLTVELKTVYDIGTGATTLTSNTFLGVGVDPNIHAAPPVANAFIAAFGLRPRTANKLGWIEATAQNGADYVAELASVASNKSDVAFAEKTRAFAKIAHTMRISTEFNDWFEQLYNYCVNEGVRMIYNKIDAEICNGAGVDVTYPNKVYGLIGSAQHTAFSALGSYQDATVADVIFDAAMQIAKEGFNANVAFVTWAIYAQLRGLKDANGNYIFDQARSQMGGITVYPSGRLSAGEIYVVDSSCVEIYAGNSFELEFIRNGLYDAYDVFFRKAVQVKVSAPNKKGVIYVASASTAQAAINVDGPVAALAGTVDSTAGAIKTKAVTA